MFGIATETYILWAAIILGLGGGLSLFAGFLDLSRARNLPFFLLRRQTTERGWRNIFLCIFLWLLGLAALIGGKPLIEIAVPPTVTPTISPTPSASPTQTLTATITLTPSPTLPPTDTLTPSPTVPPTETPTPGYPAHLITPIPEATVTPNPEAVIGLITVAVDQTETGQPIGASANAQFDAATLTKLVALYSYDKMTNGVQTSTIWYRDGAPIYIDTALWQGGTGGSTVVGDECPLEICLFLPGNYRVAIFVGDQLKRSADFVIVGTPPTRTSTPSDTPTASNTPTITSTFTASATASATTTRTNTATRTASWTPSATATATITPSRTSTATRRATFTRTATATVTPSRTASATATATATRTASKTLRPILQTDYARTAQAATATAQAGGGSP